MSYLHCGRCGLQITIQSTVLRVENCPRCMASTGTVWAMTLTSSSRSPTSSGDPGSLDCTDALPEPFVLPLVHSDRGVRRTRSFAAADRATRVEAQPAPETRLAAAARRAHQGAMAAAIRALRSHDRPRDTPARWSEPPR